MPSLVCFVNARFDTTYGTYAFSKIPYHDLSHVKVTSKCVNLG